MRVACILSANVLGEIFFTAFQIPIVCFSSWISQNGSNLQLPVYIMYIEFDKISN